MEHVILVFSSDRKGTPLNTFQEQHARELNEQQFTGKDGVESRNPEV